jgi:hypothetical protein
MFFINNINVNYFLPCYAYTGHFFQHIINDLDQTSRKNSFS